MRHLIIRGRKYPTKAISTAELAWELLYLLLEQRPKPVSSIMDVAKENNLGKTSIYKAADELGVDRRTTGFGKDREAVWSMPPDSHRPRYRHDLPRRPRIVYVNGSPHRGSEVRLMFKQGKWVAA